MNTCYYGKDSGGSAVVRVLDTIVARNLSPAIFFSFARREVEALAMHSYQRAKTMATPLNDEEEAEAVEVVRVLPHICLFSNILRLSFACLCFSPSIFLDRTVRLTWETMFCCSTHERRRLSSSFVPFSLCRFLLLFLSLSFHCQFFFFVFFFGVIGLWVPSLNFFMFSGI